MMSPSILFVSHSAELYGAERCLLEVILASRQKGYTPLVLFPKKGPFFDQIRDRNMEAFVIPHFAWYGQNWRVPKAAVRAVLNAWAFQLARRILKKYPETKLIYSNTLYSVLGSVLAMRCGLPHLWHVHEFVEEDIGAKFDFGAERSLAWVGKSSDRVLCNSQAVYEKLLRHVPASKLHTVPNGIRLSESSEDAYQPLNVDTEIRICLVGRIAPHKRQEDAVLALDELVRKGYDLYLTFVGDGERGYIRKLKTMIKSLNLDDRVKWTGFMAEPAPIYQSSHMAFICSAREPFGLTGLEAMNHGCALICSASAGVAEFAENGKNALTYPAGNYRMLALKVEELIGHPELYADLVRNGKKTVSSNFSNDRYAEDVTNHILNIEQPLSYLEACYEPVSR